MKSFFKTLQRVKAIAICTWIFCRPCFLVCIRSFFNKNRRATTNQYLHEHSIRLLKNIRAQYQVTGLQHIPPIKTQPRIYMSNHLSFFDTPLFYASIHDSIRIVTKKELTKIPVIGRAILNAEHVIVDRQARGKHDDFYADAKVKLKDGIALWFFPEGTRSRTGDLLPFRAGGFRLATEIGAQIIPVGITGTHRIMAADTYLPHLDQSIGIHVGEPVDAREFTSVEKLMESVNQRIQGLVLNGRVD